MDIEVTFSDGFSFRSLIEYLKMTSKKGNFLLSENCITFKRAREKKALMNLVEIRTSHLLRYMRVRSDSSMPQDAIVAMGVDFKVLKNITKTVSKKDQLSFKIRTDIDKVFIAVSGDRHTGEGVASFVMVETPEHHVEENFSIIEGRKPFCKTVATQFCIACQNLITFKAAHIEITCYEGTANLVGLSSHGSEIANIPIKEVSPFDIIKKRTEEYLDVLTSSHNKMETVSEMSDNYRRGEGRVYAGAFDIEKTNNNNVSLSKLDLDSRPPSRPDTFPNVDLHSKDIGEPLLTSSTNEYSSRTANGDYFPTSQTASLNIQRGVNQEGMSSSQDKTSNQGTPGQEGVSGQDKTFNQGTSGQEGMSSSQEMKKTRTKPIFIVESESNEFSNTESSRFYTDPYNMSHSQQAPVIEQPLISDGRLTNPIKLEINDVKAFAKLSNIQTSGFIEFYVLDKDAICLVMGVGIFGRLMIILKKSI